MHARAVATYRANTGTHDTDTCTLRLDVYVHGYGYDAQCEKTRRMESFSQSVAEVRLM